MITRHLKPEDLPATPSVVLLAPQEIAGLGSAPFPAEPIQRFTIMTQDDQSTELGALFGHISSIVSVCEVEMIDENCRFVHPSREPFRAITERNDRSLRYVIGSLFSIDGTIAFGFTCA